MKSGAVLDSSTAISAMATNEGDLVGLCLRRHGQAFRLSRSACGDDHAYGWNGLGSQLLRLENVRLKNQESP